MVRAITQAPAVRSAVSGRSPTRHASLARSSAGQSLCASPPGARRWRSSTALPGISSVRQHCAGSSNVTESPTNPPQPPPAHTAASAADSSEVKCSCGWAYRAKKAGSLSQGALTTINFITPVEAQARQLEAAWSRHSAVVSADYADYDYAEVRDPVGVTQARLTPSESSLDGAEYGGGEVQRLVTKGTSSSQFLLSSYGALDRRGVLHVVEEPLRAHCALEERVSRGGAAAIPSQTSPRDLHSARAPLFFCDGVN